MTRRNFGILLAATTLVGIYAILAAAEMGMSASATAKPCAWKFPKWLGCTLASHESLAGGLIAVGGALFAGWLAWTAVQDQIRADKELSTRREEATYQVIRSELRELLDLIALIWRTVDHTLAHQDDGELHHNGAHLVRTLFPNRRALSDLDSAVEISKDLDPKRKRLFVDVMIGLRALFNYVEYEPVLDDRNWLLTIRIQFSHLERYLRAFDPGNNVFAARTKVAIDPRSTAEHLVPLVAEFEQHGHI